MAIAIELVTSQTLAGPLPTETRSFPSGLHTSNQDICQGSFDELMKAFSRAHAKKLIFSKLSLHMGETKVQQLIRT